jgi:hypothetical protein
MFFIAPITALASGIALAFFGKGNFSRGLGIVFALIGSFGIVAGIILKTS